MHAKILILTALLLLAPIAIAQGPEECRDAPEPRDCLDEYCEENDDPRCEGRDEGPDDEPKPSDRPREGPQDEADDDTDDDAPDDDADDRSERRAAKEARQAQAREQRAAEHQKAKACQEERSSECRELAVEFCRDRASTRAAFEQCGVRDRGAYQHISFDVIPQGIANVTLDGKPLFFQLGMVDGTAVPGAGFVRIAFEDSFAELSDHREGLLRFKGDGNLGMRFPIGTEFVTHEAGIIVHYTDGRIGKIVADEYHTLGFTAFLHEFGSFHIVTEDRPFLNKAVEERRLGALVEVQSRGDVDVRAYDDLEVKIDLPEAGRPLRIEVGAHLDEGRTVSIDLDRDILGTDRPEALALAYFDVHDDGSETEVVFRMAASLDDVLQPNDDGGQPEYWIVQDLSGLHLLVSIPNWSVHAITATVIDLAKEPSVWIGAAAGVFGTALAAVFLLRRR